MKKIYIIGIATAFALTSCEDFLDTENYTGKDSSNFPLTEADVNQMVAAVYGATLYEPQQSADASYFSLSNLASDDMYGGGGKNDQQTQALDHLLYNKDDAMSSLWTAAYAGIARANSALASVENIVDEDLRNQTKGELLFLRAFNYFDLAKAFGNIPLMQEAPNSVEEAQVSPEQVKPEVVFQQIASDLYEATQIMPSYPYDGWTKLTYGKVTRWAAQALLARVYLYYTGFFQQSSMPMAEGEVTKDYVVKCLDDCIQNSGHGLLTDYRSLWAYSNEKTALDYNYVSDLGEKWSEGNKEALFSINFTYLADWSGTQLHMSNQYALFFGIRFSDIDGAKFSKAGEGSVYPFGGGWGMGPVAPNLWNEWKTEEPTDPRREASILEFPSNYNYAADQTDNAMETTGLHQKKTGAVRSSGGDTSAGGSGKYTFCAEIWGADGTTGHYQASSCQSMILIRYADVLLMHSELTQTADGINQVRSRAGLPSVNYSDKALRNERRWELAFEGLRWDDLRRWHIAPEALTKQVGGSIYNVGVKTTMKEQGGGYASRYNATNGYYRIPQAQVSLSNGAIKQNSGWEGTSGFYASWQE